VSVEKRVSGLPWFHHHPWRSRRRARGQRGVAAAVVELDPLADPVWDRPAEDHHLAAVSPASLRSCAASLARSDQRRQPFQGSLIKVGVSDTGCWNSNRPAQVSTCPWKPRRSPRGPARIRTLSSSPLVAQAIWRSEKPSLPSAPSSSAAGELLPGSVRAAGRFSAAISQP